MFAFTHLCYYTRINPFESLSRWYSRSLSFGRCSFFSVLRNFPFFSLLCVFFCFKKLFCLFVSCKIVFYIVFRSFSLSLSNFYFITCLLGNKQRIKIRKWRLNYSVFKKKKRRKIFFLFLLETTASDRGVHAGWHRSEMFFISSDCFAFFEKIFLGFYFYFLPC